MDWGFVTAVLVTGMVIVFLALIGLVLVIYLTGHTASRFDREKRKRESAPVSEPVAAPAAIVPTAAASVPVKAAFVPPVGPGPVSEAVVGEGIPAKTVAAISAAVTAALEGQGSFGIKRIVRS